MIRIQHKYLITGIALVCLLTMITQKRTVQKNNSVLIKPLKIFSEKTLKKDEEKT